MGPLVQRVRCDRALQCQDSFLGRLERRKLQAERAVQLPQRRAPRIDPRLVPVLGEKFAAVEVERVAVRGGVGRAARLGRRALERVDVADDGGVEPEHRVRQGQAVCTKHPPRGVERLVQVVLRRGGVVDRGARDVGCEATEESERDLLGAHRLA